LGGVGVVSQKFRPLTADNRSSRMVQKEREMIASATEHDKMMAEIIQFTSTVVGVAEMRDVPAKIRAEAIFMAEKIFHKVVMSKMLEKCVEKSTPCNN